MCGPSARSGSPPTDRGNSKTIKRFFARSASVVERFKIATREYSGTHRKSGELSHGACPISLRCCVAQTHSSYLMCCSCRRAVVSSTPVKQFDSWSPLGLHCDLVLSTRNTKYFVRSRHGVLYMHTTVVQTVLLLKSSWCAGRLVSPRQTNRVLPMHIISML